MVCTCRTTEAYPLRSVEDFVEPRTKHGERRVSARLGRAGEKGDFFSILLGFFWRVGCKFESMNPSIFQWTIQRLIDQTMPIQQILPSEGGRDHHHFEMIHRAGPIRDRDCSIRHRPAQVFGQYIGRNHGLSNHIRIRIPYRKTQRQFAVRLVYLVCLVFLVDLVGRD